MKQIQTDMYFYKTDVAKPIKNLGNKKYREESQLENYTKNSSGIQHQEIKR